MSQVKLFVGNLPYSVQGDDLKNMFSASGNVVRADIQLDFNKKSKGYGFVVYETRADADKAIQMFNGHEINGRNIEVREDRRSQPSLTNGSAGAAPVQREQFVHDHDPNSVNGTTLFVGNLPWSVAWQDLKDLFRQAGVVTRADIARTHPQKRSRGFGTVTMGTVDEARQAVTMFNGYDWKGRKIEVRENRPYNSQAQPSETQVAEPATNC